MHLIPMHFDENLPVYVDFRKQESQICKPANRNSKLVDNDVSESKNFAQ